MIGRMSSMQLHQGSLDVILDAQARLQRTQEELASGKRILNPADDPIAASQMLMTIQSELSRIETTCNKQRSNGKDTRAQFAVRRVAESTVGASAVHHRDGVAASTGMSVKNAPFAVTTTLWVLKKRR